MSNANSEMIQYTFFAIFCLLSLIWTFYFIPETKGKSLEGMDQYVLSDLILPLLDDRLRLKQVLSLCDFQTRSRRSPVPSNE